MRGAINQIASLLPLSLAVAMRCIQIETAIATETRAGSQLASLSPEGIENVRRLFELAVSFHGTSSVGQSLFFALSHKPKNFLLIPFVPTRIMDQLRAF